MRFLRTLCLALAAAPLAACISTSPPPPSSSVEISDSGGLIPGARASIGADGLGIMPDGSAGGLALEIGWSKSDGAGTQILLGGEPPVRFGGMTFSGPQELKHGFDFRFTEVAVRGRGFPSGGRIGFEAMFGVAGASLDLRTSAGTRKTYEELDAYGLTSSFGVIGRLLPGTHVQGRAMFYSSPSSQVSRAQRVEIALVQALFPHVAARAGYTTWSVESKRDNSASAIHVKFSGPSLGLDVAF